MNFRNKKDQSNDPVQYGNKPDVHVSGSVGQSRASLGAQSINTPGSSSDLGEPSVQSPDLSAKRSPQSERGVAGDSNHPSIANADAAPRPASSASSGLYGADSIDDATADGRHAGVGVNVTQLAVDSSQSRRDAPVQAAEDEFEIHRCMQNDRAYVETVSSRHNPAFVMTKQVSLSNGRVDVFEGGRLTVNTLGVEDILAKKLHDPILQLFTHFCSHMALGALSRNPETVSALNAIKVSQLTSFAAASRATYDHISQMADLVRITTQHGTDHDFSHVGIATLSMENLAALGAGTRLFSRNDPYTTDDDPSTLYDQTLLAGVLVLGLQEIFGLGDEDADSASLSEICDALTNPNRSIESISSVLFRSLGARDSYSHIKVDDLISFTRQKRTAISLVNLFCSMRQMSVPFTQNASWVQSLLDLVDSSGDLDQRAFTDRLKAAIKRQRSLSYDSDKSLVVVEDWPLLLQSLAIGGGDQLLVEMARDLYAQCTILGIVDRVTGVVRRDLFKMRLADKSIDLERLNSDVPVVQWLFSVVNSKFQDNFTKWLANLRQSLHDADGSEKQLAQLFRDLLSSAGQMSAYSFNTDLIEDIASYSKTYAVFKRNHRKFLTDLMIAKDSLIRSNSGRVDIINNHELDELLGLLQAVIGTAKFDIKGEIGIDDRASLKSWGDKFGGEVRRVGDSILASRGGGFAMLERFKCMIPLSFWVSLWNESDFGSVVSLSISPLAMPDYLERDVTDKFCEVQGTQLLRIGSIRFPRPSGGVRTFLSDLARDLRLLRQGHLQSDREFVGFAGLLGSGTTFLSHTGVRSIENGLGGYLLRDAHIPKNALDAYGPSLSVLAGVYGTLASVHLRRILGELQYRCALGLSWLRSIDSLLRLGKDAEYFSVELDSTSRSVDYLQRLEDSLSEAFSWLSSQGGSLSTSLLEDMEIAYVPGPFTGADRGSSAQLLFLQSYWNVRGDRRAEAASAEELKESLTLLTDDQQFSWCALAASQLHSTMICSDCRVQDLITATATSDIRVADLRPFFECAAVSASAQINSELLVEDSLDERSLIAIGRQLLSRVHHAPRSIVRYQGPCLSIDLATIESARYLGIFPGHDDGQNVLAGELFRKLSTFVHPLGARHIVGAISGAASVPRAVLKDVSTDGQLGREYDAYLGCDDISALACLAPSDNVTLFGSVMPTAIPIRRASHMGDIDCVLRVLGLDKSMTLSTRSALAVIKLLGTWDRLSSYPLTASARVSSLVSDEMGRAWILEGVDVGNARGQILTGQDLAEMAATRCTLEDLLMVKSSFVIDSYSTGAIVYAWQNVEHLLKQQLFYCDVPLVPRVLARLERRTLEILPAASEELIQLDLLATATASRTPESVVGTQLIEAVRLALLGKNRN